MRSLSKILKKVSYDKEPDADIVNLVKEKQNYIIRKCSNNEEETKARIKEVLDKIGYKNTKLGQTDLAVYDEDENPIAIFEVKAPKNTKEMIDERNITKKSLWEILLNLQEEKNTKKSIPLWAIITNGIRWYAIHGHKLSGHLSFIKNEDVKNTLNINDKRTLFKPDKRSEKYKILDQYAKKETEFIKRCLDDIITFKKPEEIATFLSRDILAEEYNPNKGNVLNKEFYNELLYIFGLEEKKINGKKQIVPNNVPDTFYSQVADRLKRKSIPENEIYEKALELIVIWLNRILFLKLFEGRLQLFNKESSSFKFMDIGKVTSTAKLKYLFFEVLNIPEKKRTHEWLKFVPYLNSSLFEEKVIEEKVSISDILGDSEIPYYKFTVLKNEKGKRRTGNVKLLNYLFEFLDAYDFSSDQNSIIQSNVISPAVLGLIFEKINGYKDGSYYTPPVITNYMAQKAIEKAIVEKVNEVLKLNIKNYAELKKAYYRNMREEEKEEVKNIIKTLTIIDPAVGSGHFLVSALNDLFFIRWDLGIDNTEKLDLRRFKVLLNGDLQFRDFKEIFVYDKNDSEKQAFQEYLFNVKRSIIENNLFGVDINPKAAEIARLRMWIELLKNAYYKPDGTMETLPNIDINIKVGNSLTAPLLTRKGQELFGRPHNTDFLKEKGIDIKEYKSLFSKYQNSTGQAKKKIKEKIKK